MSFDLTGRTAVVTGGAGPLGAALCDALASAGAQVMVVDVDRSSCRAVVDRLPGRGHVVCDVDLLDTNGPEVVEQAVREVGRCDVLVNNAALTGTSSVDGYAVPFLEQTDDAFDVALHLNLRVPFSLMRRLSPFLGLGSTGSIVNISSIYGLVGPNMALYRDTAMGNPAAYAASKGGLGQLTRYAATVLAPHVRVNAVAPGGIERGQTASFVERYEHLTPLGRMGTEQDFTGAVTWLASDASAYVTGQVIAVDGGWTAW